MRILHILDHSIPLHSGYTFRTLAILRAQRALGWETLHLTGPKQGPGPASEDCVEGLQFFRTPPASRPYCALPGIGELALMKQLTARIADVAEATKPDVLHAHSPVLNAIPAIRVGRRMGIPVVYEVRAFWEDGAVDHGTANEWGLRYRLTRGLESWALRRVDAVTTICEGLRADIVDRGIDPAKVTVIPNAVDVRDFCSDGVSDEALKRKLGLTGKTVIGYIGSFYAYEGLDILIRALPRILDTMPEVRLLLVGGGPQDGPLRSLAEELGLRDKVVFTGRVPHADIQSYYELVDLLAYPRKSIRLTELVTPLKPLEAMAMRKLLVASDIGGHRELIDHGRTGMLFKAGDPTDLAAKAVALLGAPHRWTSMQDAGRDFVTAERNGVHSVARYRGIYQSVCA